MPTYDWWRGQVLMRWATTSQIFGWGPLIWNIHVHGYMLQKFKRASFPWLVWFHHYYWCLQFFQNHAFFNKKLINMSRIMPFKILWKFCCCREHVLHYGSMLHRNALLQAKGLPQKVMYSLKLNRQELCNTFLWILLPYEQLGLIFTHNA